MQENGTSTCPTAIIRLLIQNWLARPFFLACLVAVVLVYRASPFSLLPSLSLHLPHTHRPAGHPRPLIPSPRLLLPAGQTSLTLLPALARPRACPKRRRILPSLMHWSPPLPQGPCTLPPLCHPLKSSLLLERPLQLSVTMLPLMPKLSGRLLVKRCTLQTPIGLRALKVVPEL